MSIFQTCISQFDVFKNAWKTTLPAIPENFAHNGITVNRANIEHLIEDVYRLLNLADNQANPDMAMISIHYQGITSQCTQLTQYAAQLPTNPAGYLPHILNSLWGLKSSIFWVLPKELTTLENWPSRAAEIEGTIQSISETYSKATKQIVDIRTLQTELNTILESLPKGKELSAEIQKVSQEVTNAKTSAEGSAVNAAAKSEEAAAHTETLNKLVEAQNQLISYFEKKKLDVESTLEGASKVALAASFSTLQSSHRTGKDLWRKLFYWGIAIMVSLEVIVTFLPDFPSLSNDTWLIWFVSRLTIVSPIIWFTWFASLQYSRAMRLEEDYAFKSASAQSFYGYRKEMGADEELLKLLQETAIKNFGANPIRVIEKGDHGSPMHELIDKLISNGVLDKGTLEKIADALKNFLSKNTV